MPGLDPLPEITLYPLPAQVAELPTAVHPPGADWRVGYRAVATSAGLPPPTDRLDGALAAVAQCLNPLLDGTRTEGVWDPERPGWRD